MRQDLQSSLRGFEVKVAQNQLVFRFLQLPYRFRGAGGRVDAITTGFEYGFQRQARRRIGIDQQDACKVVIEATWQMTHFFQPGALNRVKEQSQFNPESLNFDLRIFVDSTWEVVFYLESSSLRENPSEDPVHVDQITVDRKRLLNLFNRKIRKHFLV